MTRPLALPPNAALLHQITVHIAQSIKLGMPLTAALKYELHHQIYPLLTLAANNSDELSTEQRIDLKLALNDSKIKARLISALLSAIAVNLLVYHDIVLEASRFDDLLIEEFSGAGEVAIQAAMVRAITLSLQDVSQELFPAQEINFLRSRQATLVKVLNDYGLTVQTFSQALPEVEVLVDQFWQIEGQIDELMHGEADWRFRP